MFYRWLHKTWKYFWGIVLTILLVVLILVGSVMGLLQLDMTQNYLADRIENQVEQTYKADLSIGEIDGFLPFRLRMQDVVLTNGDSARTDTLAAVDYVDSDIDVWGLLQNKISITSFTIERPRIWLQADEWGSITLLERQKPKLPTSEQTVGWFRSVEVIAPAMQISNGAVTITSSDSGQQPIGLSEINATFFVDWSEQQRYLDVESFSAATQNLQMNQISFSGQVYSDSRFLEFNSFDLNIGDSQITLNGEIDGVNLFQPDLESQFMSARYDLNAQSGRFFPQDFQDIIPDFSDTEGPFTFDIETEGTTDSLWVDRASVGKGESIISINGLLQHLRQKDEFEYQFRLDRVALNRDDLQQLFENLDSPQYQALTDFSVTGTANGTLDSVNVKLGFSSPIGELSIEGQSQLVEPFYYKGSISGRNLDVSSLASATLDTTALNFDANLDGFGITLKEAVTELSATFYDSKIDKVNFERLEFTSSLVSGLWKQEYEYRNNDESISGSGWVDFSREEPPVSMQGNAQNIDLAKILGTSAVASTSLNFDYNVEVQGLRPDRIQGRANLDVKPSVIGSDTVRAHQLYMDLNSPDAQTRSFRLTSSLLDMNISGQLVPSDIFSQAKFWKSYLTERYRQEILMDTTTVDSIMTASQSPSKDVIFDGDIRVKDLSLIKDYIPDFPELTTDSRIKFDVNTDGSRLLISAEMQADSLEYNQMTFRNGRSQLTASFRSDQKLKDFSSVDFQTDLGSIQNNTVKLDSVNIGLALKQDSVFYSQEVDSISGRARFDLALSSSLKDSSIVVNVRNFFMGNDQYAWTNEETPSFTYQRNGNISFSNFSFQNENEFFALEGTHSTSREDSLSYVIRDVNLKRISNLIRGQVDFSGILNGTLVTRSLTRQPTIQGELSVNRFQLNNRMVGDVSFNSEYNPQKDRFDTQIDVITDTTKYENYLESNDQIGQNIQLDGYFVTPNPSVEQDTVFYFDANFNQIDMWVIPLITSNVFSEMEGEATGEGYITGNLEDFDFHADFQTQNVFAKPQFLNTNYFISGHVGFDRDDGVILDSLDVLDTSGGTGVVSGTVDLNDFNPITYLDLTLDMNNLQFLNNTRNPEVPFFGNVSGSGTARLTGSNRDLYLRTENPIQLTSDSEISVPLLEETELSETGQFIRFVDSFEEADEGSQSTAQEAMANQQMNEEELEAAIESMTFSERFDLDLQFDATDNVTVHLLFDPVTGEILTAEGTGQLRLTMQDQDVQMFGRYTINDGTYQFVTGEIISRRLELEPGGTIVWEGPPNNARLDISAVYRARPNIATLTSETTIDSQDQNNGQQVPVDLIVEINGTINSVENDYYFRLPNSLDISSNSTLSYTINQINRDDQQKLLQATSILFTGQFIPTENALRQSLTRGTTVLNPLISNQVISPLLSNQINSLLNSNVSRLDVDFNLNAYNEVDLGIALRLYNDRLILRREGQITGSGPQSTLGDRIGDLNATYRIRRGLSLTAFHRQDQVLNDFSSSSRAGDVTPSVDGVGLEARVQFNTWKELLDRIGNIFGKDKKKKENTKKEITEQKAIKEEK